MKIINFFLRHPNRLILCFTVVYLLAFMLNAVSNANYEFLYYTSLMGVLIIILIVKKNLHLAPLIVLTLSLGGLFHLMGGSFFVGTTRLYDYWIIPHWFRYDNFIHTFNSFNVTLALYSVLVGFIDERLKKHHFIFSLILMLMAMGLGTVVELIELFAVLYMNAAQQVGGYFNNAFDLFFNMVGSGLAAIVIYFYRERVKYLEKVNETIRKIN